MALALVLSSMPAVARADATSSLIAALFGVGNTGGGGGQYVNGDPATQVIPLLQQIYKQNANNAGVDNDGKRLQTRTATQIADYQEQNQWERERRLRNDEIARNYPEMSNYSCAIASVAQSGGIIDSAAANTTAQVAQLLTSGMYKSVMLATELSADYKAQIWCKLGATGINGTCTTDYDILTKGADNGHTNAITVKDSIPCDMPGVVQEFEAMRNPKNWNPNPRHKECVAAILSIANEYPVSSSLPTKEEASTTDGKKIWDRKINQIAMAAGAKGGVFEKFNERVSVPSGAYGCNRNIQAGGRDMYTLLREDYLLVNATREPRPTEATSFGMPPSGFCISKMQYTKGQILMAKENRREKAGARNLIQLAEDQEAIMLGNFESNYHSRTAQIGGINTDGLNDMDRGLAERRVSSNDHHQEELLGAIRQLTSEIKKMNAGVYADKVQEVSLKKGSKKRPVPVGASIAEKSAEVTDALKEMGLKVSAPSNGVLAPITQEFPVLPPQ